jgi:hypothetical protein
MLMYSRLAFLKKERLLVKDIREIMMEMKSSTNEQIAVELSEEEKSELKNLIHTEDVKGFPWGRPTPPPCVEPCSDEVPYCNKVLVPNRLTVSVQNRRIAVSSSLYCFVDPCPCEVSCTATLGSCQEILRLTVYPVRVIGCLNYVASIDGLTGEAGAVNPTGLTQLSALTNEASVSAQGTICVNQIVKFQKNPPTQDQRTPKRIAADELGCTINAAIEDCTCSSEEPLSTRFVSFSGIFKLPSICPSSAPCPTSAP